MFAPDTAAITEQLSADYAANAYLMAWGHTLMNTSLYNEDAKTALTGIATMWETLAVKLEAVMTTLKSEKVDAKIAVQKMNINAARTSWKQTADWAEKIQNLAAGTVVQPPLQHASLLAAFG